MNRGSCLCGAVRYEVSDPFEEMHHCHCSKCRKAHGAAFSTFARTSNQAHFVGSKAPWHDITDELPQFNEYPPEA